MTLVDINLRLYLWETQTLLMLLYIYPIALGSPGLSGYQNRMFGWMVAYFY